MRLKSNTVTKNAIIACTYAMLTLFMAPISYGQVQIRLSEIMVYLSFYNKKWTVGLVGGCLIANLSSPLGIYDVVFGTFSTMLVCIAFQIIKNKYLAGFVGSIITGMIVGYELSLAYGLPPSINIFYVGIGEFIVLMIGAIVMERIEKNKTIMNFINN